MTETERHSSHPAILIWLLGRLIVIWQQMSIAADHVMKELHIYEYLDMAAVYLVQHPMVAVFAFAMALCCGIPVLMFVVFAVISVILTFTGFLVIEGTILTIGSVLLCGFLLGMVVVMITLAATIGVAYLGFREVYGLLQNSPENSPVSRYLSRHLVKQDTQVVPRKNHSNAHLQDIYSQHED